MFGKLLGILRKAKVADLFVERLTEIAGQEVEDLNAARERIARGVAEGDFDDVIRSAIEADRKQARRAR